MTERSPMGISPFKSTCGCTDGQTQPPQLADPKKFEILELHVFTDWLVAYIRYQGASNFDGYKVLVFHDVKESALRSLDCIDPHFCEGGHIAPVARFIPTLEGWRMALTFVHAMEEQAG